MSRRHRQLLDKLTELEAQIRYAEERRDKTEELSRVSIRLSEMKIEKSRIEEEFARERREIEHKVGLEQKRQTQEIELAKREAKVEVGESNLKTEREQFEKNMKFLTDRMTGEVDRINAMFTEVLKRVPDISAALEIGAGNRPLEPKAETPSDGRKRKGA